MTMRRHEMLNCEKCDCFRWHTPQGETAMQCDECGSLRDGTFAFAALTPTEENRCKFQRHRVTVGALTEWPGFAMRARR